MTDSLEDTIATVLARIRDQFPGDIVYTEATHGSMLHALLDEEGPEALVAAVLSAEGVVPPEPAGHDTLRQAAQRLVDHAQEVRFNPNEMSVRFHDWKALRAAVAAVDGEVLA